MRIPARGGVEWYGDPLADGGGAHIVSFSETRPFEIYRELMLVQALMHGAEDTPDLRLAIELRALDQERREIAETRARGIAAPLRALLGAKKKRELELLARDILVEHGDFYDLTRNCGLLGLSRHTEHHNWAPKERSLSEEERASLFDKPEPKVVGKVRQLLEEREHRSVHMFTSANGSRWHCFYLTFKDVAGSPSTGEHHWRGGSHVHFVNYLFNPKKLTRRVVLDALAEREHSINGIHIRYEDLRRRPDTGERIYVDPGTGRAAKVKLDLAAVGKPFT
jgi:hypothetical protein